MARWLQTGGDHCWIIGLVAVFTCFSAWERFERHRRDDGAGILWEARLCHNIGSLVSLVGDLEENGMEPAARVVLLALIE